MNTSRIFELYARYVWPIARRFVRLSRRCNRCILSERYASLSGGLCPECSRRPARPVEEDGEASAGMKGRFDRFMRERAGRTNSCYDAVLLLSGGKDSAYILHRLRQEYPQLRILCVTVDNGFMSPVAVRNAEHVARKLEVDWLVSHDQVPEFARIFREAFLSLNGRGTYGVVDHADGSKVFEVGKQIAGGMEIPLLIGGLTWVQVQRIVGQDDFQLVDGLGPVTVFPLAVWRVGESEIRRTVRTECLVLPGSDSPIVSNSPLIVAMSAVDVLNNGYSSFEPEFAQLVREGKADRKTWIHVFELLEFAAGRGLLDRDLRRELSKLDLSVEDVVRRAT